MASSTLDLTGDEPPVTTLGHGTSALGPSDSTDSGSDIVGGPGMDEGLADEQSREMPETTRTTAGRDLGDFALGSDSDSTGTGERGSSGIDTHGANDLSMTVHGGLESAADILDEGDLVDLERVDSDSTNESEDDDDLDDVPASDGAT